MSLGLRRFCNEDEVKSEERELRGTGRKALYLFDF